jgi:hypothetical protein
MAQIHSYYITNAKSELKFSSSNLSEDELKIALQEITTAMINNDDLFVEEEEEVFSDSENIDLDEENVNNLLMENIMILDNFSEQNDDVDLNIGIQNDEPVDDEDHSNIDFEAILNEELGNLNIV